MDGIKPEHEERAKQRPEGSDDRQPYVKPDFQFERVFETMALHCGKISLHQKHCGNNTKS